MCEMQRAVRLCLAAGALGLGVTVAGGAQAEDVLSANVTMTTDYLFRGISRTGERPAIQGGFDYTHTSGFYLGTWASNVNYGSDTSTEIDYCVGFAGELAAGVGYDFSFIYFNYPGDDYSQGVSSSWGGLGCSLNYVGTTLSGLDAADNRLVFAISKSF